MKPNRRKKYRWKKIENEGLLDIEIIPQSMENKIIVLEELMRDYFRQHDIEIKKIQRRRSRLKLKNIITKYIQFPRLIGKKENFIHFKHERKKKDEKSINYVDSLIAAIRRLG